MVLPWLSLIQQRIEIVVFGAHTSRRHLVDLLLAQAGNSSTTTGRRL